MKKIIAFIAMLGMVAISNNIQAVCNNSTPYYNHVDCTINSSNPYDGGDFYATPNAGVSFFWHIVNNGPTDWTYAAVGAAGGRYDDYISTPYAGTYNGTYIQTDASGWFYIYIGSNNGGYAYATADW